jgi:hypothetical protein
MKILCFLGSSGATNLRVCGSRDPFVTPTDVGLFTLF